MPNCRPMHRRAMLHLLAASAVTPVIMMPLRDARAELQFDLRPGAFKPMPIASPISAGRGIRAHALRR